MISKELKNERFTALDEYLMPDYYLDEYHCEEYSEFTLSRGGDVQTYRVRGGLGQNKTFSER